MKKIFTLAALALMGTQAMAQSSWNVKIGSTEYPMTLIEGSTPETYTATVTCEVESGHMANFSAVITDGTNTSNNVTTSFTLSETKNVQFWGQYPKGKSWIAGLCSQMEYPISNASWMYLCQMPAVSAAADAQSVTYFNESSSVVLKSALGSKAPSDVYWMTANSTGNPPFGFTVQSNTAGIKKISLDYATWKVTVEAATTIDVTIGESGSATFCAPADLTIPAGIEAYTLAFADNQLKATEVTTSIPANTPVLLKAPAGNYSFAIATETTNIATDTRESNGKNVTYMPDAVAGNLYGVMMPHYAPANSYLLSNNATNQEFVKVESDKMMVTPFTAYLVAGSEESSLTVVYDGSDPTGISEVRGQMKEGSAEVYNLSGQRVSKAFQGIVVKNGRKMIQK